ncbi:RraA family protein [Verminephrobacter eiseniae]|nr:RraA family protein [Verminephrobacter eiseniae]
MGMSTTTDSLLPRLQACYTGILHDVMRAAGLRDFTLPPTLRPLIAGRKLCGPAFTVDGRVDPGADPHETLMAWTGFLSRAEPGHIAVIQPNDSVVAHMGELSAETLGGKGVLGVIADGGLRDAEFIIAQGFQVWHRYFTPRDVVGYWLPDALQVPVRIGAVTVNPGDLLLADTDGVICIPLAQAEAVISQAETMMARENLVRSAILAGTDPQQAYLKYRKF